jgi:hypothetical protein
MQRESLSLLRQPVPLFTAAYAVAFAACYRHAWRTFGCANSGGSPRWRNALGQLPQTIVLPTLLLARAAVPSASAVIDTCFSRVFASLMLFDLSVLRLNATMLVPRRSNPPQSSRRLLAKPFRPASLGRCGAARCRLAHHGTCLAGHAFAAASAPEAYLSYFASVVALELGSGLSCSWWLWGEAKPLLTPLYAYGGRRLVGTRPDLT